MKRNTLTHLVRLSLCAAVALISACNKNPSDSSGQHQCSNNPYLMKYGCSIERIQSAAEAGNPDAQYALGYMYYYGIDTVKDRDTALLWIQRSARQGQPLAKKAWALINTNASFDDLHQEASQPGGHVVRPQVQEDTSSMNQKTQSASVNNELPGYGKGQIQQNAGTMTTGMKTDKLHDTRLAKNAKPEVGTSDAADTADTVVASAKTPAMTQVAKNENGYTLQLLGSQKLSDINNYISAHKLGAKAHYYETKNNGKPWYMLTYGHYATQHEALVALHHLPASLDRHQPWVKSMAVIEREVASQNLVA